MLLVKLAKTLFFGYFRGHIVVGKTKKSRFPNKCADGSDPPHQGPTFEWVTSYIRLADLF